MRTIKDYEITVINKNTNIDAIVIESIHKYNKDWTIHKGKVEHHIDGTEEMAYEHRFNIRKKNLKKLLTELKFVGFKVSEFENGCIVNF